MGGQVRGTDLGKRKMAADRVYTYCESHDLDEWHARCSQHDQCHMLGTLGHFCDSAPGRTKEPPYLLVEKAASSRRESDQGAGDEYGAYEQQQPLVAMHAEMHGGASTGPREEDGEEHQVGYVTGKGLQAH
jgi:hypothetical protein